METQAHAGVDQRTDDTVHKLETYVSILCCPRCQGDLSLSAKELACVGCGHRFAVEGQIPLLFLPNDDGDPSKGDVTELVKSVYEETPFPDFDDFDDVASLIEKARRAVFPRMLDDQIPFGTNVLEVGCGTGQL